MTDLNNSSSESVAHKASPIALEEWKQLQPIIARLEETEYKIRNWLFPLMTALSVALFSNKFDLAPEYFAIIGISLTLGFMSIELMHRIPKRFAIGRVMLVESVLRQEREYDGPRIAESMSQNCPPLLLSETWRMLKRGPYIPVFLLILFFTWIAL